MPFLGMIGTLIFVGGVVYSFTQVVIALRHNDSTAALTAGGLTLFCSGVVAMLAATTLTSPRSDTATGEGGTTLRINSIIVWCYGAALVGAVVGSASYLILMSSAGSTLPFAAPGRGVVTQVLMGSLLVLAIIGLAAILIRREPGRLQLGPDGIESADIFRTRTAAWRDIVDILDKADRQARNPIVFVLKDGKPIVVSNADRYERSFGALYWMTRYYWKHPESRDELTDRRALDRLHNEQFEPN